MSERSDPKVAPATLEAVAAKLTAPARSLSPAESIPQQLRRRADEAMPMRTLRGRWGDRLAARDPALDWPPGVDGPATFDLDEAELRAEVRRQWDAGWQRWELAAVFDLPGLDAWAS